MSKFFDEQGNAVEAFSKEELDAQIKTASEKAIADLKAETPPAPPAPPVTPPATPGIDPAIAARLDRLEKQNSELRVSAAVSKYAGTDPEKAKTFRAKFDRLQGYEDSETGLAERAADAAKLAFGTDAPGIDVTGLANAGGKSVDAGKTIAPTEADKAVQGALGITAEDVKKYGEKV